MTSETPTTAPPPAPKPKRPRTPRQKMSAHANAAVEGVEAFYRGLEAIRAADDEVQIPADTDPASAFRADMQLRKAIATRRLEALEARRAAVDGDRRDRKALIDAEANAKKERLDSAADAELVQLDEESASVIRTIAGIGAALDASVPPSGGGPLDLTTARAGGYIGLQRISDPPVGMPDAEQDGRVSRDQYHEGVSAMLAERDREEPSK